MSREPLGASECLELGTMDIQISINRLRKALQQNTLRVHSPNVKAGRLLSDRKEKT
jgi:hypothetical protein